MRNFITCCILVFILTTVFNQGFAADVTIQFVPFRPQLNPPQGEEGGGSSMSDKIVLNDNTVVEGTVTKYVNGHYTIKVGNFEKVLHESLIKSINDKAVSKENTELSKPGIVEQNAVIAVSVMPFPAGDLERSVYTVFPDRLGSGIGKGGYESDWQRVSFQKELGELKRKSGGKFAISDPPTMFKVGSVFAAIDMQFLKRLQIYSNRTINVAFPYAFWPIGFQKEDEFLFALVETASDKRSDYGNISNFKLSKEVYTAKVDLGYTKAGKFASINDGLTVDGPVGIINKNAFEPVYSQFLTSTGGGHLPTRFAGAGKFSMSPNLIITMNKWGYFDYIIPSDLRDPKNIDGYEWLRANKDANGFNISKIRSIEFSYPDNVFGNWAHPNTGSNAILYGKFHKDYSEGVVIIVIERVANAVTKQSSCKGKITFFHETGSIEREFKLPFAIDRFGFYCVDIDSDGVDEILIPCSRYQLSPARGNPDQLVELKL